ncbi:MAG: sugar transferase [Mesorhizobium sp.]|nr:sugar transferase [Mesorhizobium sp.]MBN9245288.1 sugar transferase [Mesorhizobium sp.]
MSLKRTLDFCISFFGLVLLAPFFAMIALAIRLESPGPAFFLQERVGYRGRLFRIVKFRTMRRNAPKEGPQITIGADPRITRIGGWLRKTKLDELPQLINVLKGDMSLVGPRPEVPAFMSRYPTEQRDLILSVRPGITDFAAIEFSDEADILARADDPQEAYVNEVMPRKFALYKRYVDGQSLWLDLKLIGKTLAKISGAGK